MANKEKPKSVSRNKPTLKQKKTVKNLVENGGNLSRAMRDAGYAPAYAKNPKKFRETASFQELLDTMLPDWLLAETHMELLDNEDPNIRLRASQEGYKIKAKYAPEQHEHTVRNYHELSDEELAKKYNAKTNARTKK